MRLFRGEKYGVFQGSNGYYVAPMAEDGVSHYQPGDGGNGWSAAQLKKCNDEAKQLEEQGFAWREEH